MTLYPSTSHNSTFVASEIVLGPKLGEGKLSDVYEVESFQIHQNFAEVRGLGAEEIGQRIYMREHEKYRSTRNARYALKHIKEKYFLPHGREQIYGSK